MFDYVVNYFSSGLGLVELVASALTLLCVYLVAKQSIWNFFWGGIAVILYGYIFLQATLYADMVLQWGYYLPMAFYGYYFWKHGYLGEEAPLRIGTGSQWVNGVLFLFLGTLFAGYVFTQVGAALPYPDSYILVASIFAQYLLSRKIVESWVVWVSVNLVAIPTYFYKELYITSGLYVILLFLASYGLYSWMKSYNENRIDFGKVPPLPSRT